MKKYFPFYNILLPLIWGVCSYFHHYYPGDENAMWIISSLAGLWIAPFVFFSSTSKEMAPVVIAFAGAIVMLPIGILMDFLHVRKLIWAIIFSVCTLIIFCLTLMSYPSLERAINKNGSIWAYIFFSINIGIYISIILSIILALIFKLSKSKREDINTIASYCN